VIKIDHFLPPVSSYRFKYSDWATDLFDSSFHDNSSLSLDSAVEPKYAGSTENVVLRLDDCEKGTTYFIALRAVDKAQKVSRVSNIASFYVPSPVQLVEYADDQVFQQPVASSYSLFDGIGIVSIVSLTLAILFFVMKIVQKSGGQYTSVPAV